MKRLTLSMFLLASVLWAQSGYNSYQATTFTAAGSAVSIPQHSLILYHQIYWVPTSASVCTVTIDSSPDNVTWTTGGVISSQVCTSSGNSSVVNTSANYIRVTVQTLTGTSVKVTYFGWINNPNGGGGGAVNSVFGRTGTVTAQTGDYTAAQVTGAVPNTTTVNGHALSSNVTISASDLTTGTLPHAQLPTLLSGDIPNNAANTTGTSGALGTTPTPCSSGQAAGGIAANGNSINCVAAGGSPLTTNGDLYTYNGGNTRLSIGSTGQFLSVISGLAGWNSDLTDTGSTLAYTPGGGITAQEYNANGSGAGFDVLSAGADNSANCPANSDCEEAAATIATSFTRVGESAGPSVASIEEYTALSSGKTQKSFVAIPTSGFASAIVETGGFTVSSAQATANSVFYYNGGSFATGFVTVTLPVTGFTTSTLLFLNYGTVSCSNSCSGGPYYIKIQPTSGNINGASGYLALTSGTQSSPAAVLVSWDNTAGQWTGVVLSSSSGTVTSVSQTVPSWLTVTGSPITSSGTLAILAATGQTYHQVLGTCGTATSFGPCSLVAGDLPSISLTTGVTGILPQANGGTGVANTATLTLGTSNINYATLGTGIIKNTTTTGAQSLAVAADIYGLWSGTCSSSTYLSGSGTCSTPSAGNASGFTFGATNQPLGSTAPSTNQYLQWNGTNWVGATPSGSGSVASGTAPDIAYYATSGTGVSDSGVPATNVGVAVSTVGQTGVWSNGQPCCIFPGSGATTITNGTLYMMQFSTPYTQVVDHITFNVTTGGSASSVMMACVYSGEGATLVGSGTTTIGSGTGVFSISPGSSFTLSPASNPYYFAFESYVASGTGPTLTNYGTNVSISNILNQNTASGTKYRAAYLSNNNSTTCPSSLTLTTPIPSGTAWESAFFMEP